MQVTGIREVRQH